MGIKLITINLENHLRYIAHEVGDYVLESDEGFVDSWGPIAFKSELVAHPSDTNRLNAYRVFTIDAGALHSLLNTAYDSGKHDQRTQTARQLKNIFGL